MDSTTFCVATKINECKGIEAAEVGMRKDERRGELEDYEEELQKDGDIPWWNTWSLMQYESAQLPSGELLGP